MHRLWRWWTGRIHYWADGPSYIRFNPNPGFNLKFPFCPRIKWSRYYGWKRVRE